MIAMDMDTRNLMCYARIYLLFTWTILSIGTLSFALTTVPPSDENSTCMDPGNFTVELTIVDGNITVGSYVTLACPDGFTLNGSSTLWCQYLNETTSEIGWNTSIPTCIDVNDQPTAGPTSPQVPTTTNPSTGTTPLPMYVLLVIIISIPVLLIVIIAVIVGLVVRRNRRVKRYLTAKPEEINPYESVKGAHKIELKPRAPIIGTIDYDDDYLVPVVPAAVTTGRKRSGQAENHGNLLTVDDRPRLPAPTSIARSASNELLMPEESVYQNSANIVISRSRENLHKEPPVVAPVTAKAPAIPTPDYPSEEEPTYENQTVSRRERERGSGPRGSTQHPPVAPTLSLTGSVGSYTANLPDEEDSGLIYENSSVSVVKARGHAKPPVKPRLPDATRKLSLEPPTTKQNISPRSSARMSVDYITPNDVEHFNEEQELYENAQIGSRPGRSPKPVLRGPQPRKPPGHRAPPRGNRASAGSDDNDGVYIDLIED